MKLVWKETPLVVSPDFVRNTVDAKHSHTRSVLDYWHLLRSTKVEVKKMAQKRLSSQMCARARLYAVRRSVAPVINVRSWSEKGTEWQINEIYVWTAIILLCSDVRTYAPHLADMCAVRTCSARAQTKCERICHGHIASGEFTFINASDDDVFVSCVCFFWRQRRYIWRTRPIFLGIQLSGIRTVHTCACPVGLRALLRCLPAFTAAFHLASLSGANVKCDPTVAGMLQTRKAASILGVNLSVKQN